jgi:glutamate transport system substrate-binding protein
VRPTRIAVAVLVVAAVAGLAALVVYRPGQHEKSSIAGKGSLVIGVDDNQPGLGARATPGSRLDGFDVDVATYIAGRLGVSADDVTFKPIAKNNRERVVEDGTVDLLFASFSITPERRERVTFGGPYYVAHQDIMVREHDTSIKNVRDLKGARLCQVAGSYSWQRVTEEREITARPVSAGSYRQCVGMLTSDRVDAVSTDDLILAGIAANVRGVKMVEAPFSDERYGVAMEKGDIRGCEAVNEAITEMYQSGAAETMLTQRFGSGLDVTTTEPQFEGCS